MPATYTIVPQEKTVKGEVVTVLCKDIRFFPIEKPNEEMRFGKLKNPIFQIKLQHEKATPEEALRIKCNVDNGEIASFVVQQPDKMEQPTFTTGKGKTRRKVPDYYAEPVRVPGVKEVFKNPARFVEFSKRAFGEEMTSTMLSLFEEAMQPK